jgi:hypothetical protein
MLGKNSGSTTLVKKFNSSDCVLHLHPLASSTLPHAGFCHPIHQPDLSKGIESPLVHSTGFKHTTSLTSTLVVQEKDLE